MNADMRITDPLGRHCDSGPQSSQGPGCIRFNGELDLPNGYQIHNPAVGTYKLEVMSLAAGEILLQVNLQADRRGVWRKYRLESVKKEECLQWEFMIAQSLPDSVGEVRIGDPVHGEGCDWAR
jgi:hypothetical protein